MELFDHPSWSWGLSLIVLTMAIHAAAVVMLAFVEVKIRIRLEIRDLNLWNLIAILICLIAVIGLLLAVLHGIECGIWAVAYLWLARRIRPDAAPTLANDGRSGGSRWDATVRCEHGVHFAVMQVYSPILTAHVTPSKS